MEIDLEILDMLSFNPCCIGRYAKSSLIHGYGCVYDCVSILVVLEDMLKVLNLSWTVYDILSFNPCCIGRYAKRCVILKVILQILVSILVVLEDMLKDV